MKLQISQNFILLSLLCINLVLTLKIHREPQSHVQNQISDDVTKGKVQKSENISIWSEDAEDLTDLGGLLDKVQMKKVKHCPKAEMNRICAHFCTQAHSYDDGICTIDPRNADDPDKAVCYCSEKTGLTKILRLERKERRPRSKRTRRNIIVEESEFQGRGIQRQSPFGSFFPPRPWRGGCTPYSCYNECPPFCDSMCAPQSFECYCSCQDDYEEVVVEEHYGPSSYFPFFG